MRALRVRREQVRVQRRRGGDVASHARLARALAHLPALALEAARALLLPLPAEARARLLEARVGLAAALDAQQERDRVAVLQAVRRERAELQLRRAVHEALVLGRDKLNVLDEVVEFRDREVLVHREGGRGPSGLEEDL